MIEAASSRNFDSERAIDSDSVLVGSAVVIYLSTTPSVFPIVLTLLLLLSLCPDGSVCASGARKSMIINLWLEDMLVGIGQPSGPTQVSSIQCSTP